MTTRVVFCFAGLLGFSSPIRDAFARTYRVGGVNGFDSATIQGAIASASNGDSILVYSGTYQENINFLGKTLVILSLLGPESTVIDGSNGECCVVRADQGETAQSIIQGFTITGGLIGISIYNSALTIKDNVIRNNSAALGAGISCNGLWTTDSNPWTPIIENNLIQYNTASVSGGGIFIWGKWSPVIVDNTFQDNRAEGGDGGAIYLFTNATGAIVARNEVLDNYASDHGGGFYFTMPDNTTGSFPEMEIGWNLIARNIADGFENTGDSGGGIWLARNDAWIHHNTVVGNTGNGPSPTWGGGIAVEGPAEIVVEQNIVAFSMNGAGLACFLNPSVTFRNNLAWQNTGGDGAGTCSDWWQSGGNVVDNPYFCDMVNGDYTVAANSGVITHPAGPLGAFPTPGCGPVSILPSTWGSLKSRYH